MFGTNFPAYLKDSRLCFWAEFDSSLCMVVKLFTFLVRVYNLAVMRNTTRFAVGVLKYSEAIFDRS